MNSNGKVGIRDNTWGIEKECGRRNEVGLENLKLNQLSYSNTTMRQITYMKSLSS